jgi:ComF family protein
MEKRWSDANLDMSDEQSPVGLGSRILDFLYPPRCLKCETRVAINGSLCPACWLEGDFISGSICCRCGVPFEIDSGEGAQCGACIANPPSYDQARSIMVYNDASRPLVTGFKYGDRTERAPAFGRWLARAGTDLLATADLIIPVPLHPRRLIARRFNQSGMLAQSLGRETLIPVAVDGLVRLRATKQQVGLSHAKRKRNVRGAFIVRAGMTEAIKERHIVLIDDVITSGATIEACVRALRKAQAREVSVLSVARVVNRR